MLDTGTSTSCWDMNSQGFPSSSINSERLQLGQALDGQGMVKYIGREIDMVVYQPINIKYIGIIKVNGIGMSFEAIYSAYAFPPCILHLIFLI